MTCDQNKHLGNIWLYLTKEEQENVLYRIMLDEFPEINPDNPRHKVLESIHFIQKYHKIPLGIDYNKIAVFVIYAVKKYKTFINQYKIHPIVIRWQETNIELIAKSLTLQSVHHFTKNIYNKSMTTLCLTFTYVHWFLRRINIGENISNIDIERAVKNTSSYTESETIQNSYYAE